jgi:plasmid maintenance system antidote protein VapI
MRKIKENRERCRFNLIEKRSKKRKPVSPAVTVSLGKLFGDGAGVWARMQSAHDIWHAERELAAEIKKIPTLKTAAA